MSLGDLGVMLNVAIALIFLYLAVSLACSAALEAIAGWFERRAKMLKKRLKEMLTKDQAKALYDTSIIKGLSGAKPNSWFQQRAKMLKKWLNKLLTGKQAAANGQSSAAASAKVRPSYIPAVEFTSGVIEMASTAGKLDRDKLPAPLAALYDEVKGDLDPFKARIGLWYDNAMAPLTGKYDRWSQLWLFLLGIVLAALFNLDSLSIGSALWADRARLEPLVQQIETFHEKAGEDASTDALADSPEFKAAVAALAEQLPAEAAIPLGYEGKDLADKAKDAWERLSPLGVIGWLITGLAAMLGAKFWFNTLGQALQLRAAGVKPATTEATTSGPGATPAAGGGR